jgi:hypothetical protein
MSLRFGPEEGQDRPQYKVYLKNIPKFCTYCIVKTSSSLKRPPYKSAVQENDTFLFSETYETHKCTLNAKADKILLKQLVNILTTAPQVIKI